MNVSPVQNKVIIQNKSHLINTVSVRFLLAHSFIRSFACRLMRSNLCKFCWMSNLAECVAKIKALFFYGHPFYSSSIRIQKKICFCYFLKPNNITNRKPTNVKKYCCKFTWNSHSYRFHGSEISFYGSFFFYCAPAHLILDFDGGKEHVFETDVNKWMRGSLKYPLASACIVLHEEPSTTSQTFIRKHLLW